MYDCIIRIERLQNGYTLRVTDPAIKKANRERDMRAKAGTCAPWQDPEVSYAFTNSKDILEFLTTNIDKVLPKDEFSSTFDQAVKEVTDD